MTLREEKRLLTLDENGKIPEKFFPTYKGDKGDTGLQGIQGVAGPTGLKGDTGAQGIQGVKGDTGSASSIPGPAGPAGTSSIAPGEFELRGSGMPNGVVSAPPGTYYTDTAVTNGALRWAKVSGTGTTGWQVVKGATAWRYLEGVEHFPNHPGTTGAIRRVGDIVQMIGVAGTVNYGQLLYSLPYGFRGINGFNMGGHAKLSGRGALINDEPQNGTIIPMTFNGGAITFHGRAASGSQPFELTWFARDDQPWPIGNLPGIEVTAYI